MSDDAVMDRYLIRVLHAIRDSEDIVSSTQLVIDHDHNQLDKYGGSTNQLSFMIEPLLL